MTVHSMQAGGVRLTSNPLHDKFWDLAKRQIPPEHRLIPPGPWLTVARFYPVLIKSELVKNRNDRIPGPGIRRLATVDVATIFDRGRRRFGWPECNRPLERLAIMAEAAAGLTPAHAVDRDDEETLSRRIAAAASRIHPEDYSLPPFAVALPRYEPPVNRRRVTRSLSLAVLLLTRLSGPLFIPHRPAHAPSTEWLEVGVTFFCTEVPRP